MMTPAEALELLQEQLHQRRPAALVNPLTLQLAKWLQTRSPALRVLRALVIQSVDVNLINACNEQLDIALELGLDGLEAPSNCWRTYAAALVMTQPPGERLSSNPDWRALEEAFARRLGVVPADVQVSPYLMGTADAAALLPAELAASCRLARAWAASPQQFLDVPEASATRYVRVARRGLRDEMVVLFSVRQRPTRANPTIANIRQLAWRSGQLDVTYDGEQLPLSYDLCGVDSPRIVFETARYCLHSTTTWELAADLARRHRVIIESLKLTLAWVESPHQDREGRIAIADEDGTLLGGVCLYGVDDPDYLEHRIAGESRRLCVAVPSIATQAWRHRDSTEPNSDPYFPSLAGRQTAPLHRIAG